MPVELHDVPGRPRSPHYSQVAVATGSRLVFVAGQVGTGEDGRVVPGGLAAQAERAMLNVASALDAVDVGPAGLARLTVYVVGWSPELYPELGRGLLAAAEKRAVPPVPLTLIGVQSLFEPEMLIEIEATASAP